MRCPSCSSELIRVIDSRPSGANTIRRRRECVACARFTTYERASRPPHERLERAAA